MVRTVRHGHDLPAGSQAGRSSTEIQAPSESDSESRFGTAQESDPSLMYPTGPSPETVKIVK